MDFTKISDQELLDMAANASGIYDGLRIYGEGALSDLVAPAKVVWDAVRAEIEARGLSDEAGL
jgi:hypothetical protein